jgi:hypothetical protein
LSEFKKFAKISMRESFKFFIIFVFLKNISILKILKGFNEKLYQRVEIEKN